MCALVQAIRKVGIVAGGPGIGERKNPMHIVRVDSDSPHHTPSETPPERPTTSSSNSFFDSSFGQKQRASVDPATQVEDDDRTEAQMPSRFYGDLDGKQNRSVRIADGESEGLRPAGTGVDQGAVERGFSIGVGRRRKTQTSLRVDLEKGESQQ